MQYPFYAKRLRVNSLQIPNLFLEVSMIGRYINYNTRLTSRWHSAALWIISLVAYWPSCPDLEHTLQNLEYVRISSKQPKG
jgi:hypothetical protein